MATPSRRSKYLVKFFADSAGKKGGEFYTPGKVVRLLVQVVKPRAGREVDDPTMGSGGFLIQSHQYVEEQGENLNDLALFGQDSNGTVMPHGVLFRSGKEKLIRELLINDDVIEAIISLPPGLFYGTGIPSFSCPNRRNRVAVRYFVGLSPG